MLHLFLLCYDPTKERRPDEPASRQAEHAALERELREEGVYVSGGALMPPELAPIVRVRRGDVLPTDGPFAEAKELIGGYFIINCKREDAVRYASRIPTNSRSWVQVRQIALFHPNPEAMARWA